MPFLYTVGAVVFVFGTLFSLAVGRRERRTNKKIWDAAGLPILASDAEDIEARKHS
jgi:chemotaxis receptor (MCP) glutamine deamidase CheD